MPIVCAEIADLRLRIAPLSIYMKDREERMPLEQELWALDAIRRDVERHHCHLFCRRGVA